MVPFLTGQGVERYKHIQEINVSCNQLATLKPLGELKHLCTLNASYNQLHRMFDFSYFLVLHTSCSPPANLQLADYSNNNITKIEGAHKHRYLRTLVLDNNQISVIEGLSKNVCLSVLSFHKTQPMG